MGYPRLPLPYPFCQWGEGEGVKIPDHGNVLYCIALELVGTILRRQSALKWIHKRGNWWWPPSDRGRGVDPNCISRQKRQCTKAKTKKATKDKDV